MKCLGDQQIKKCGTTKNRKRIDTPYYGHFKRRDVQIFLFLVTKAVSINVEVLTKILISEKTQFVKTHTYHWPA